MKIKVAVIGSGWYGSHIARVLAEMGHEVTLYEKEADIFGNISAKFGIRLHAGPHYPRSKKTRESCQRGFEEFRKRYPELVVDHEYSIYGLGKSDANNEPSHVNYENFNAVCKESITCKEIDPKTRGYTNLIGAWDLEEPSIVLGERLRERFREYLNKAGVNIKCNYEVKELQERNGKIAIGDDEQSFKEYDYIINATSYQALIPNETDVPFKIDLYYQPLLALVYEDTLSIKHPFSLIMMDGLFPCMMPYVDRTESGEGYHRKYVLTHAKWTTLASCKTVTEANAILAALNDNFIKEKIKPACEAEMIKFWPEFKNRFNYFGWKESVLAKLKTNREFRSAVTFERKRVIYIIPGKVSNIFDVEHEVLALITNQNVLHAGEYRYVQGGVLHDAIPEISERPNFDQRNTCAQQTFMELLQKKSSNTNTLFFQSVSEQADTKTVEGTPTLNP